jgi:hypothetical protein
MRCFLIAVLCSLTLGALAQTPSAPTVPRPETSGNLPTGFYPKSPCIKPGAPDFSRKPDQRNFKAVEAYNEKIRAYNKAMEAFNPCIQDYAARANHDIQEIRAAVAAANAN